MKYIIKIKDFKLSEKLNKTFESIRKPKLNDYVLCEDSDTNNFSDHNEYIRTHIGKIIKIKPENQNSSTIYVVKYKDVPNLKPLFHYMMGEGNVIYHDRRGFFLDEIKFFSPTKKTVELMMTANKFNI